MGKVTLSPIEWERSQPRPIQFAARQSFVRLYGQRVGVMRLIYG
ncbi:hypothetical protein [Nostoc sp. DSM 114159]